MKHFFNRATEIYKRLVHGVSLIPALLAIFLFLLAVVVITTEFKGIWDGLLSTLTFLRVRSPETARTLVGSILGGMISLTVFTFSMVMVVINQASTNYSPKVIESFINNNSNKYILGIFVGTIIFSLTTLMHIEDNQERIPDIAIFLTIILALYSIALFVKFINNISNSVRITNIAEKIYKQTRKRLQRDKKDLKELNIPTDNWRGYESTRSGYFQQVALQRLALLLKKHDLTLRILAVPGSYLMEKTPLFSLDRPPEKEEVIERIRDNFFLYSGEDIEENEFYGFRQLREIAVKGLSPGINDPGIAKLSIDYLGDLLAMWMAREKKTVVEDDEGQPRIILNQYTLADMLSICITPVKSYGKRDFTIVNDLLSMFLRLSYHDEGQGRKKLLNLHARSVVRDAGEGLTNYMDRHLVNDTVSLLNRTGYFSLPYLENDYEQQI